MKYRYLLPLFLSCAALFSNRAAAQLVGDNAFLQGQWLECAIAPNGSWGNTMPVPGGYHTHTGSFPNYVDPITGVTATGDGMDFSYDQGHDGWTVGANPFYGAYFLPGTPFDGWSIQIDDTMSSAFYSNKSLGHPAFDTTLGGIFGGTVTGYTGPRCEYPTAPATGIWTGTAGLQRAGLRSALQITQVNEVDPFASWVTVTTKFVNTTDSLLKGVYYFVTADPDNDVTVKGGSFPTNNHIPYQGGLYNRHEVFGRPPSLNQDAFSGLATYDCRAKALIYQFWPPAMVTGNNLDKVYNETATGMGTPPATVYSYKLDTTTFSQDIAYGLVFKIGDIAPRDSAFITYAWIFSDTNAVDSILTVVPKFSTLGNVHTSAEPDSVIGCDLTACGASGTTFTADVLDGQYRDWSFSKWTWTPAIGLSATTGTHVIVDAAALSSPVTYTITGTQVAAPGSCITPHPPVTFTMYVKPCFFASSDKPCENDTLHLIGHGDSTGATYMWYGPGGYTSTGQFTYIYPARVGTYMLVKTVGLETDTAYTNGFTRPLPDVIATSDTPCSQQPLNLKATLFDPAESFSWTGPGGFISGVQNPARPDVSTSNAGSYKVKTTLDGCSDSAYVTVVVDSTPMVPVINSSHTCFGDTLWLSATDATELDTMHYTWSGPASFVSANQDDRILMASSANSGVYTVTATLLKCSSTGTGNVLVLPLPVVVATSDTPCSQQSLNLGATVFDPAESFSWTGPDGFTSDVQNPARPNVSASSDAGAYKVKTTLNGCSDSAYITVVVDSTPLPPVVSGSSSCSGDTLWLTAADATLLDTIHYTWSGPLSFVSSVQNDIIPIAATGNSGVYTVTATLLKCSSTGTGTVFVRPSPPLAATSNSPVCSGGVSHLDLQAASISGATFTWTGPYTFSSSEQNPVRLPVLTEYSGIYTVKASFGGCSTTRFDTVVVNETPLAPWTKWLTFCQYYLPDPLQAMGDNILWYTQNRDTLIGSTAAPVPNTNVVGETFFYATQTVKGCISPLDSMKITVYPSPVVTISPNVTVCPHETATLKATDADVLAYYHWYPSTYLSDTSSPEITVHPETNIHYTVVASNMFGCTDTAHVAVTVKAGAVLELGDSVTIYAGEQYQLNPATNCSYISWFPSTGLSDAHITNPVASPQVSTRYIATGMSESGCRVSDSIDIYVSKETLLAMPNAFAPGNGPNSKFKVLKKGIATLKIFAIFDRWGVKVFETTDIEEGWDGTYKGVPQPFGVYIYEITAVTSSGENFVKRGNVTLVR